jgi:hypothetical protein
MPTTDLTYNADNADEVTDARIMDLSVSGPDDANHLVIASGVVLAEIDDYDRTGGEGDWVRRRLHILVNYRLREDDRYLNISGGNTDVLHASAAFLAHVSADDDTYVDFALDRITAKINTDRRIQLDLDIGTKGDVTLTRIAYFTHVLLSHRPRIGGARS